MGGVASRRRDPGTWECVLDRAGIDSPATGQILEVNGGLLIP